MCIAFNENIWPSAHFQYTQEIHLHIGYGCILLLVVYALKMYILYAIRHTVCRFPGHQGAVRGLTASTDGRVLVSCGTDST